MQPFLASPVVTQGHQGSTKVKNKNKIEEIARTRGHPKIKLAGRASTTGPNWSKGPIQHDQTSPKVQ